MNASGTPETASVSRRNLLRLALAGVGTVAAGPALARTGVFGGNGLAVQQGRYEVGEGLSGTGACLCKKNPALGEGL